MIGCGIFTLGIALDLHLRASPFRVWAEEWPVSGETWPFEWFGDENFFETLRKIANFGEQKSLSQNFSKPKVKFKVKSKVLFFYACKWFFKANEAKNDFLTLHFRSIICSIYMHAYITYIDTFKDFYYSFIKRNLFINSKRFYLWL